MVHFKHLSELQTLLKQLIHICDSLSISSEPLLSELYLVTGLLFLLIGSFFPVSMLVSAFLQQTWVSDVRVWITGMSPCIASTRRRCYHRRITAIVISWWAWLYRLLTCTSVRTSSGGGTVTSCCSRTSFPTSTGQGDVSLTTSSSSRQCRETIQFANIRQGVEPQPKVIPD